MEKTNQKVQDKTKLMEMQNTINSDQKLKCDKIEKLTDEEFKESLLVSIDFPTIPPEVATNDTKREVLIYKHTLDAAKAAVDRLKKLGVNVWRPDDAFMEMFKNDKQMGKVRKVLAEQDKKMDKSNKRKRVMMEQGKKNTKTKAKGRSVSRMINRRK